MIHKRIFVVDDEPDMIKIATDLLEQEGFVVLSERHPVPALKKIRENPPDLLLLDVRMPELNGFQVLQELKTDIKTKFLPVIVISVNTQETDVVLGLEMGADDYIQKPFRKRELLARVRAVLRRKDLNPEPGSVAIKDLFLDYTKRKVTFKKKPIALTPKEFELLGFLMLREGRVLTRSQISEAVWGHEHTGSTRTIDVHIDQLRKKLGPAGAWVLSLRGIGYRLDSEG